MQMLRTPLMRDEFWSIVLVAHAFETCAEELPAVFSSPWEQRRSSFIS